MSTRIQCLCGDVKLELSGEPMAQCYCHCDNCQAAHSAPYVLVAMYPKDAVKVTEGKTMSFAIRDNQRVTCVRCGTRLFQDPPAFPVRGVNAMLLPKGQFKPAWHQQCQFAVMPVEDTLPHFKGYPAAIGGSDELVGW